MSARTPRWLLIFALVLAVATGCEAVPVDRWDTGGRGGTGGESPAQTADAKVQLRNLSVTKTGSMRGYSRDRFPHWRTTGDNCNVRDEVLKRDGTKVKFSGCNVVAGTWKSIYDGRILDSPTKVDIDHVVPLANAWRSGASGWTDDKRADFANDLRRPQLVAVSRTSNRAKGDQDPSTWKPSPAGNRCEYARDWIAVKSYWKLSVTKAEKAALTDMLQRC